MSKTNKNHFKAQVSFLLYYNFFYSGSSNVFVRSGWDGVKTDPCFCAGLVSKQKSEGEKTEKRRGQTEMGSVFQKHEEVARQLQIR